MIYISQEQKDALIWASEYIGATGKKVIIKNEDYSVKAYSRNNLQDYLSKWLKETMQSDKYLVHRNNNKLNEFVIEYEDEEKEYHYKSTFVYINVSPKVLSVNDESRDEMFCGHISRFVSIHKDIEYKLTFSFIKIS